jgi:hypothetical protein
VLYDEENVAPYEKFKPYMMPKLAEERKAMIAHFAAAMRARSEKLGFLDYA